MCFKYLPVKKYNTTGEEMRLFCLQMKQKQYQTVTKSYKCARMTYKYGSLDYPKYWR